MSVSDGLSRRAALQLALAGAGAAALPAEAFAAGETLRAAIAGFATINTLDPGKASLNPEFFIIYGVFNTLLKFDANMKIVPDLAESYKVIDPTTLEFKLRSGVKFHDGGDFTAEDVKFTIDRIADPKFTSPSLAKVDQISSVEIIDKLTVRIHTKTPFAPLLTYLTNIRSGTQIVSKAAVTRLGDEAYGRAPVGTGPMILKSFKSNESVTLEAFPQYFRGVPAIAGANCPLIAEESSGLTAILGKQIDFSSSAPFASVPTLKNRPDVHLYQQSGLNTRFVGLNVRQKPFDDVHFRRALSMAFDRSAMVAVVLFGAGQPITGLIPPAVAGAYNATPTDLATFNAERARAELAKSKYGPGTEAVIGTFGSDLWRRMGEVFVAQVNQTLGTKLRTEYSDFNALYERMRAGSYQAAVFGWLGLVDPDEYMSDILGTGGVRNFSGYSNGDVDALIAQGRAELDQTKRGAIYQKADRLMLEDMPIVPCFAGDALNLGLPNLKGFTQLPYSNFADQFGNVSLS